ncbi:hypothetical protein HDU96_006828 [Phlyctochytrium bullatum]|nr:hypothetical protein HDU96_006828 [Phlyctochytrium bullatum]
MHFAAAIVIALAALAQAAPKPQATLPETSAIPPEATGVPVPEPEPTPVYPFIGDYDALVSPCLYDCYFASTCPNLAPPASLHDENEGVVDCVCSSAFLRNVGVCARDNSCPESRGVIASKVLALCLHVKEHVEEGDHDHE